MDTDNDDIRTNYSTELAANLSSSMISTTPVDYDEHQCGISSIEQCQLLRTLKDIIASISLVCIVITMVLFFFLRKYKHFSQRLLMYFFLSLIIDTCNLLVNDGIAHYGSCVYQGFVMQASGFSEIFWLAALAAFLYMIIIQHKTAEELQKREWLYLIICYGLPLAIACLPLTTHSYGPAGPYCWISNKTDADKIWRFVIFWIPVFVALIVILCVYIYMHVSTHLKMKKYLGGANNYTKTQLKLNKEYLLPLTIVFASYLVIHFFQLVNRVQNLLGEPIFALVLLHVICFNGYGIFAPFLFVITNGRKAFTREEFNMALRDNKQALKIRSCLKESIPEVKPYPFTPSTTPKSTLERGQRGPYSNGRVSEFARIAVHPIDLSTVSDYSNYIPNAEADLDNDRPDKLSETSD